MSPAEHGASNMSSVMPSFISDPATEASGPGARRDRGMATGQDRGQAVAGDRVPTSGPGRHHPRPSPPAVARGRSTAAPMWPRSFGEHRHPDAPAAVQRPEQASAGTSTSVKKTSSNSRPRRSSGAAAAPRRRAGRMSSRKNEMPSCLGASGSVRAMRMPQSLTRPPEHHTFWPLTTKRSPSRSARRDRPPRSLPAPGSENSWHHTWSPASVGREVRSCCSGCRSAGSRRRPARARPC